MKHDSQRSDKMQTQKPRKYQGSKYAEGRLKLSTACRECHERKQKCDQKQPCRHCSRRYPPPLCIYPNKIVEVDSQPLNVVDLAIRFQNGSVSPSSSSSRTDDNRTRYENGFTEEPTISGASLNEAQTQSKGYDMRIVTSDNEISSINSNDTSLSAIILRISKAMISSGEEKVERYSNDRRFTSALGQPDPSNQISVEPLHFLGIEPTAEKAALLNAFVKLLTKYTTSMDGNPSPNYFNDYFVPWSLKSPLLSHISIYTTAAYQSESQKIPPATNPIVLSYKAASLSILNAKLRSKDLEEQIGNEVVAAVATIVSMEWYWSEFEVIGKHLKGLVELVRLRGGLGKLEMNEFLKQMILIVDYNIAHGYDIEPSFPHNVATLPTHPVHVMTPLVSSRGVSFAGSAGQLGISKETAALLDDMRFLLLATIKQVDHQIDVKARVKLNMTATWTRDRISLLPTGNEPGSLLASDFIYQSCRSAGMIYCRAITDQISLSKACGLQDLGELWRSLARVSLTRWKQTPGIFLWVLLSAIQGAETTPYGRYLKSMLKGVATYMAVHNWDLVDGACMAFVRLQRWLRNVPRQVDEETQKPDYDVV